MPDPAAQIDKTRRPQNSLLAAGLLIAVVAVLIGFHAVTMMLGVATLSGEADRTAKPRTAPPRVEVAAPVAAPAEAPREAVVQVPAEPPAGIAAAAKAKAQAEMSEFQPSGANPDAQDQPRRRYRAPRPEMHKVY